MIITTLLSFLGGNAFRMIFGEITSYFDKRQEHANEIERLKLQGELEAAQHERNQAAIRLQAELGVQTIRVQGETDLARIDASAFVTGVELTGKSTGIAWVDAWNGAIRPLLATVCMALWVLHLSRHGWTLDEQGWSLVGAALGIFVADRTLMKRGK